MSKWPEARAIKNANAQEVADFIYEDIELLKGTFLQKLFELVEILPQ
ncbi:4053_t:CDS:2, partial [Gigaspora rosea]